MKKSYLTILGIALITILTSCASTPFAGSEHTATITRSKVCFQSLSVNRKSFALVTLVTVIIQNKRNRIFSKYICNVLSVK